MCGITGIIDLTGQPVPESILKEANDLIAHRGPDDEGFYFTKNIGFGHRRLSILDLSDAGHQPMHFRDRYVITYNGEIYNYLEIKKDLIEQGYKFETSTDTEVILASYDYWGENCVNHFNGMWAFAIHDKVKKIIFCSRDRFGVKPFYYMRTDKFFLFGSEIKQLLTFLEHNTVNKKILIEYLLYGLEEHTNETFFENIFKLSQSHNLIFDLKENKIDIYEYYKLETKSHLSVYKEKDSTKCIYDSLVQSTKLRLRSDVRVGTCLSGGLDSSSIASIASDQYGRDNNQKFMAFHAKSVEGKTDESDYAKLVAKHCKLDLKIIEPSLSNISELVDEVVYTQEEPFGGPSIFMQYLVMAEAKKHDCTVLLDGQGGDETLFGYESYYSFYFGHLLSKFKIFSYFNILRNLKLFKVSKKRIIRDSILVILRNKLSLLEKLIRKRKTFLNWSHDRASLNTIYSFIDFKSFQKREMLVKSLPRLLRYEDKNSMRNSIETRLPFVDYKFVENAISLPDHLKFKSGYLKYILRKAIENLLPDNIVWRTNKFGFEAPTDTWIDLNKKKMISSIENSKIIEDIVDKNSKLYRNKQLLWRLYNVSVWEKVYDVKI